MAICFDDLDSEHFNPYFISSRASQHAFHTVDVFGLGMDRQKAKLASLLKKRHRTPPSSTLSSSSSSKHSKTTRSSRKGASSSSPSLPSAAASERQNATNSSPEARSKAVTLLSRALEHGSAETPKEVYKHVNRDGAKKPSEVSDLKTTSQGNGEGRNNKTRVQSKVEVGTIPTSPSDSAGVPTISCSKESIEKVRWRRNNGSCLDLVVSASRKIMILASATMPIHKPLLFACTSAQCPTMRLVSCPKEIFAPLLTSFQMAQAIEEALQAGWHVGGLRRYNNTLRHLVFNRA
jgi:hypothetical protein